MKCITSYPGVIRTLNTIRKALKDTDGAAADDEETLQRLNHLGVVLPHLQALHSEESSRRQDHVIWHAANACYEQLKRFIVKHEKLLPDIGPAADKCNPRTAFRWTQWPLSTSTEVGKLWKQIEHDLMATNLALSVHAMLVLA
ncbi:hypothetical protein HO173_006417 [Letharia columbiana]|uniref:Uncharacterized protein n=1 Tax=Letharia columbiana TaxID=112416 RepID=A0A8H6FV23_9LECA|nr:uncharacterized protein HO173_006417 [Letharia columbiana]KAF6235223.1 hypothetical protein HO173_006417 [Letharia columbiana]